MSCSETTVLSVPERSGQRATCPHCELPVTAARWEHTRLLWQHDAHNDEDQARADACFTARGPIRHALVVR